MFKVRRRKMAVGVVVCGVMFGYVALGWFGVLGVLVILVGSALQVHLKRVDGSIA